MEAQSAAGAGDGHALVQRAHPPTERQAALGTQVDRAHTGVIIVDHGSRRHQSNDMLVRVVALFDHHSDYRIVEPAHMELAEPSIATAFDRCVQRGAHLVVVSPYFLLPGRHWDQDIPRLAAQASTRHPGVAYIVAAPLGLHPLMAQVVQARIDHCLAHAYGQAPECDVCKSTGRCHLVGA